MRASGETLAHINKTVFEKAELMAGTGYLERIAGGHGDMPLNAHHHTEGAKALAAYLMSRRADLKLSIVTPQPVSPTMETTGATGPYRTNPARKPEPPRSNNA